MIVHSNAGLYYGSYKAPRTLLLFDYDSAHGTDRTGSGRTIWIDWSI
jgi:hypothetical protein